MPTDEHLKPRHSYSVGDKIWYLEFFGQVKDITYRRVCVICLDDRGEVFERWLDPVHLRRRS